MPHILIVGQKFSALTDYLLDHDYTFTLLQDKKKTKFPEKRFKNRQVADFTSKEALLSAVDSLKIRPDAVIATYENYVLSAAWIAEYLNLPGMPAKSAEACTDKSIMRALFEKAPEKISPAFQIVASEEDVRKFASNHDFPLILKPANLAKSLLVTKNNNLDELILNYKKSVSLLEDTYKKYASNRQPKLIIEEFLEGSIHSVDAFVDMQGNPHILEQVVDYQTGYDIGYDDNFHYSRILPSTLSAEDQKKLRECATIGIKALGMKNSPAHIEIIMTKQGPRIVEIGARNGGYRERMHSLANNIDITGSALAISLGKPVNISAKRTDPCAVLELFPKNPGTFAGINNFDRLNSLSSINYLSVKAKEGTYIGKAADGYKMAAIIILHNENESQFEKDLAFINQNVWVKTNA